MKSQIRMLDQSARKHWPKVSLIEEKSAEITAPANQLANDTQQPCDNTTDQNRTFDIENVQSGGKQKADNRQQSANAVGGEIVSKTGDGN